MPDADDAPPTCPTCGGVVAAAKTFCLACGRMIAPPDRDDEPPAPPPDRDDDSPAPPRGTASLAGRLVARGTGWLGGRAGRTD